MRLIRAPNAIHPRRGDLQGRRPLQLTADQMRDVPRLRVAMLFQDPMDVAESGSTGGLQRSAEQVREHERMSKTQGAKRADRVAECSRHPRPDVRALPIEISLSGRHAAARDDRQWRSQQPHNC